MPAPARPRLRLLHISPRGFGVGSLIGGGERYVENLCKAVRLAAQAQDRAVRCVMLITGAENDAGISASGTPRLTMRGAPEQLNTLDMTRLRAVIQDADIVHVHQCLTPFGLAVAAQAKLLAKRVIGSDHGGGTTPFLYDQPRLLHVFDAIQTYSDFGNTAFLDFDVPVTRLRGPVDDAYFSPGTQQRDAKLLVAIGRILPHKGFESIIDALPDGLRLVIAGRRYDEDYFSFLQTRSNNKAVSFEVNLDDAGLLALMRGAGLCVHASLHRDYRGTTHLKPELLGLAPLECMSTGMPALVNDSSALRELGMLPGCTVAPAGKFQEILRQHLDAPFASGDAVREATIRRYGLAQFGPAYLDLVERCASC